MGSRCEFLNFLFYIGVYLINHVVVVSFGQQRILSRIPQAPFWGVFKK